MALIKSALEIALEKTESVKGDKTVIEQYEARQKGKRLANEFLSGGKQSLDDEIKKCPKGEQASLRQGLFDVFISQLTLPVTEEDLARVEAAAGGLQTILGDSRFNGVAKQLSQVLAQYMGESAQYEEAIKQQYAPKLRQKEEEIARRLGRRIELDPFQDPEFVAFYNQNMNQLKENYGAVIDQVKDAANESAEKTLTK